MIINISRFIFMILGILVIQLNATATPSSRMHLLSCKNTLRAPQRNIPAIDYFIKTVHQSAPTDRMEIESLMIDFSLTRFEAVEVQSQMRRLSPTNENLNQALRNVQEGNFHSEMNLHRIRNAKFVLVFDMDETLLDQRSNLEAPPGLQNFSYVDSEGLSRHIVLNPAAVMLLKKVKAMGGATVLYSRNFPQVIWSVLENANVDGQHLDKLFDGIMASGHMVIPENLKTQVISKNKSLDYIRKDLDLIDNAHVFIVDDNEKYIYQKQQHFKVSKFSLLDIKKTDMTMSDYLNYFEKFRNEYNAIYSSLIRQFDQSI